VGPGLRQGLEALEHSAIAIRGMFRGLLDATADPSWPGTEDAADVLLGLAQTLRETAAGVDAFGQLVHDEADPGKTITARDVGALRDALDGLHEARARLEEALLAGPGPGLLELHATVLSTVKRLLREMDLDERIRRQVRMSRPHRAPAPDAGVAAPSAEEVASEAETQLLPRYPDERRPKRRP
jgi:hypothetical protein